MLDAQRAVYANDVAANADLDNALGWVQRATAVAYASGLYEFAGEGAKRPTAIASRNTRSATGPTSARGC